MRSTTVRKQFGAVTVLFNVATDPKVQIRWPSLAEVDAETAARFADDLSRAIAYARLVGGDSDRVASGDAR